MVEADVQDDVLEEYKVERADELELSDGELNLLLAEERISPEHTCSHCGSDSNREGEEDD
ncbi:hypothetical protein [Nitrosomonas sp. Is79A3]|uniref:hypothetical protein n=1 Tax=Nitrosomonas sp. (strain Is79A3) TaxID=261292 RepID=UPI0012EA954F